jgi:hypothetical protein
VSSSVRASNGLAAVAALSAAAAIPATAGQVLAQGQCIYHPESLDGHPVQSLGYTVLY